MCRLPFPNRQPINTPDLPLKTLPRHMECACYCETVRAHEKFQQILTTLSPKPLFHRRFDYLSLAHILTTIDNLKFKRIPASVNCFVLPLSLECQDAQAGQFHEGWSRRKTVEGAKE